MPIAEIEVGERFRKDLGSLDELKASVESVGLLHPVVVLADGKMVAGARRLEACRQLGWSQVPVTVTDNLDDVVKFLMAERDENTCRLDMKPSERVALGRALEEIERPKARQRERAGRRPSGNSPEGGETRDKVGSVVGWSGQTYQRAKAIVVAAEQGAPIAQESLAEMDRTGKVWSPYKALMQLPDRSFEIKTPRHRQLAEAAHRRLSVAIATFEGHREGLEGFDITKALAVSNPEEIDGWVQMLDDVIRRLKQLRQELKEGKRNGKPSPS